MRIYSFYSEKKSFNLDGSCLKLALNKEEFQLDEFFWELANCDNENILNFGRIFFIKHENSTFLRFALWLEITTKN